MTAGKKHHLILPCLLLSLIAIPNPTTSATNPNQPQIIAQNNAELEEANQLEQKVEELYQQGKYQEAIPLAEKVLEIREKNLGKDHLNVAASLSWLAVLYKAQGNYSAAEPLLQRSLAIYEKDFGKDHPFVATILNYLAVLYQAQGNYSAAEPLFQRALSIYETALGKDNPFVATTLNNLAGLYYDQGNYSAAEPLLQRALSIREKNLGKDHPDVALSLNNLAVLYKAQGNYSAAEPLLQRALAIYEKALGKDHPSVAISLNNLAELYRDQGNYSAAEPLFQRSLAIREKALGKDHPDVATILNNLAGLYRDQGNYSAAEPLLQRSLAIREKALGKDHPDVATILNNLAGLYRDQGNYSAAEPLYQRSLAIYEKALGKDHLDVAIGLNNLAGLYYYQGNYNAAEPLYQRSLAIREKALGKDHPDIAESLNNLALLYSAQGNYSAAEPLYQRSLAIWEKALGKDHPDVATSLNNLALLYSDQGNYSAAEPLYQRSLAIWEKALGKDHPDVAATLNNLAVLSWTNNNITLTLQYLTRSTDIEETNLTNNLPSLSESRKTAYFDTLYTSSIPTTLHLQYAATNPEAARLALTTILRRKGRILDSATDTLKTIRQNLTPDNQKLLDELSQTRTQIASLTFTGIGNKTAAEHQQELTTLESKAQQLEQTLSQNSTAFRTENQRITIEAVQSQIPATASLIEFTHYKPYNPKTNKYTAARYAAYTLDSEGKIQWIDLGEAETLDKDIAALKNLLQDTNFNLNNLESRIQEIKQIARSLDGKIMQPVRKLIDNKKQLLIAPDSQLNLIPFAALVDENNQYLLENYSITYLTSGRDLIKLQNIVPSQQNAVIIANPDFQNSSPTVIAKTDNNSSPIKNRSIDLTKLDWCCNPLSGTEVEAKEIAPLLTGVAVYMGKDASKSVLTQIKAPVIIHFATHGFFLEDEPDTEPQGLNNPITDTTQQSNIPKTENPLLRSGLALAGFDPAQGKLDGALTALEIANLNLYGTKLVVLSACRTGVGDVKNGEGVYGLRRSLVLAGAESQLISLWDVADEGTKHLMVGYYQKLVNKGERGESLRQVQLEMLRSKEYNHPFFWSAFIPSGNWRSIDEKQL
jgi:CHAT domain-containing protein/lipopolysaccharide biosynthesis regulator YciM